MKRKNFTNRQRMQKKAKAEFAPGLARNSLRQNGDDYSS
jgi:hypothetical protein